MGYIGKSPEHGRFAKLDQINSGFDGSVVTFNLTVDSVAVYPTNPQNLLVSIGGVIQQPGTDYTVSAATLTLTSAPAASTDFFGVLLGDVLDIGTPSDGSVTVSKMAANSVDSAQYVDGSIDRVHLAADIIDGTKIDDDVINSEHYVAGSIDLEHMASQSVDEDNLYISNAGSNGEFLSKQSGNNGGLTWAAAGATDISCRVYTNATQSIANSSGTLITVWGAESYDTDGMHDNSTNPARITIKTAGTYLVGATIGFSANATGAREANILESTAGNGVSVSNGAAFDNRTNYQNPMGVYSMDVDDYFTVTVWQNSGGSLNTLNGIHHSFWAVKLQGST